MRQLPLGIRLRDRAGFDNFHAASNAGAVLLLQELADGRRTGIHWLSAPGGNGKTHLLQAVCARAARDRRAAYLPLRELAAQGAEILSGWEESACLCIDDVDAVLGRPDWERALFRLHNELDERGATLVWSAAAPPRALTFVLPDLASRCAHALLVTLAPLEEADRLRALQRHATARGLELPDDSGQYLLRRVPRDLERLCALLDTLDLEALAAQRRLTIPFVRTVLERSGAVGPA
jgi:DnaA family protein